MSDPSPRSAGGLWSAVRELLHLKPSASLRESIEEAIDEHYRAQAEELGEDEAALKETVLEFRAEELEHRDSALEHGAEQAPGYSAITTAVRYSTKLAIWLSSRF